MISVETAKPGVTAKPGLTDAKIADAVRRARGQAVFPTTTRRYG